MSPLIAWLIFGGFAYMYGMWVDEMNRTPQQRLLAEAEKVEKIAKDMRRRGLIDLAENAEKLAQDLMKDRDEIGANSRKKPARKKPSRRKPTRSAMQAETDPRREQKSTRTSPRATSQADENDELRCRIRDQGIIARKLFKESKGRNSARIQYLQNRLWRQALLAEDTLHDACSPHSPYTHDDYARALGDRYIRHMKADKSYRRVARKLWANLPANEKDFLSLGDRSIDQLLFQGGTDEADLVDGVIQAMNESLSDSAKSM